MPNNVDVNYALGLKPEAAINYLKSKGYAIAFDWHTVWQESNARAFTVAKAMNLDVLKDIRGAVQDAMEKGQTLQEFRKGLEPTLQAKGWWGKQTMVDPLTGKERPVQLGSPRRLETIYRANIDTAYSAGRYRDFMESSDTHPFWQMVAVKDSATRPSHRALDGKVFRCDDPFWNTHWPPYAWFCRCRVRKLTAAQVREKGLKVESSSGQMSWQDQLVSKRSGEVKPVSVYTDPETGTRVATDPGWSYNPGQAWSLDEAAWQKAQELPEEVRQDFMSEMSRSTLSAEFFPTWVDSILARGQSIRFAMTVGWMNPELWAALDNAGITPASPVIAANDTGILHMLRDAKQARGAALSIDAIKKLPEYVRQPQAVLLDTRDGKLLFVRAGTGTDKSLKVIVQVDYKLKGKETPVNFVRTSGQIATYNLREPQYKVLWGSL
ncbi:MAG: minor capsid protein [Elusimicrobia bacterium]|nr:minor capsid protein [Elusimicrobiota bacterium]